MISKGPAARAIQMVAALGFAACVTGPVLAQSHGTDRVSTERVPIVRQINLLVEDMDRSIDFYQRLGLRKVSDRTFGEGEQDAVFGAGDLPLTADPKTARLVIMKGSSSESASIGLLTYEHPRLSSARGSLAALGTGDVIITVEVPEIQEAYRRLSQSGIRFQRLPYRSTITGSDGTRVPVQRMLAFDPDGHLAEVIQVDAGR